MERIAMSQEERDELDWLKRAKEGSITQRLLPALRPVLLHIALATFPLKIQKAALDRPDASRGVVSN